MPSYEEITQKAGKFGLFQKRALISLYIGSLINGPALMLWSVFILYTPPHRCIIPEIDGESNVLKNDFPDVYYKTESFHEHDQPSQARNLSYFIPVETDRDGKEKWSQCTRYSYNTTFENGTLTSDRKIIECDYGWKYFTDPGEVSAIMEFNLVCDKAWMVPLAPSLFMLGVMIGSLVGGYLSDKFGRRFTLILWWIVLCICTAAIAVIPSWKIGYVLWILAGAATLIRSVATMVLINETTPSNYRHGAGVGSMFSHSTGYMLTPLFCYLLKHWRYFMGVLAGIEILVAFLYFFFVNESLKWLLRSKRHKEAKSLIKNMARLNKKQSQVEEILLKENTENVNRFFIQLQNLPRMLAIISLIDRQIPVVSTKMLLTILEFSSEESATRQNKPLTYLDLLKRKFLRRRLLIFGICWFATTMNYHGLSINTNSLGGNRYVACFIAGAVEIPAHCLCFVSMKKLGGRSTGMFSAGLSGICLLLIPVFLSVDSQWTVIVCSMTGKLFITCFLSNLLIFNGDLFPTLLRNQAYGAASFLGRFAGIAVPFVLYLGKAFHESIPYIIMGCVAMFASIGLFFLPETKNTPLPDTIEDAKEQDK